MAENDFTYSYPEKNTQFLPFTPTRDKEPTLYFGFDKSFENKTVTLYAQVEPPLPNELSDDNPIEKPQLVWEYSTPQGWQRLGVQDETQAFSQRGLIKFIAPTDFSLTETFGKQLYWLRVRWLTGKFRVKPSLRRLLTNTTWGVQAVSLKEEVLGSSNYEPNQVFIANNSPILMGQQLEVQEGQIPPQIEPDRLKVIQDNLGEIEEVWVLWQEVADFYGSGDSDRHYILDHQTGEIRFGNGEAGMIPPRGRNNIRLSFYRTGGGKQGNVTSQTINQLKTTIPYIDRVINLEAAAGGAQQETLDRLKERVPKQLRHRDRAVTIEDFADLAYEASTDVARVKVITPDLMTANFSPFYENFWLDPTKADVSFAAESPEISKKIEEINKRAGQVKLAL
ncbi:MAG: baseplate J/gp47 family protein [Gloeotrichia echinulata GP01]